MTDPQIPLLWTEMQTVGSDDELAAAAAAFALIACVDHDVAEEEIQRFRELVPSSGKGAPVREAFDGHVTALLDDYAAGRRAAFAKLEAVHGDPQAAARVLRIAQMAVVADEAIGDAEEALLVEIEGALGTTEEVRPDS